MLVQKIHLRIITLCVIAVVLVLLFVATLNGYDLHYAKLKWQDYAHSTSSPPIKRPSSTDHMPDTRVNATFVVLIRNRELWDFRLSMRELEDRYNKKYNYPYVFLNDEEFTEEFKTMVQKMTNSTCEFGLVPKEHWEVPEWIDNDKAAAARQEMAKSSVPYGDSLPYRQMCRYQSGYFFRHPLLLKYDYYWRVEPGVHFYCDVNYDPFLFMKENKKKYGFTLSLYEYDVTIPTLWNTVKEFIKENPKVVKKNNLMEFVSGDGGNTYNRCHFWSNFEIGDLNFWRSSEYLDYFNYLDKNGGFFYERWGDAPVHSIAASLFLDKSEVHYFEDIGYWHVPFSHCPRFDQCSCNPNESFDENGYSCTPRYWQVTGTGRTDL